MAEGVTNAKTKELDLSGVYNGVWVAGQFRDGLGIFLDIPLYPVQFYNFTVTKFEWFDLASNSWVNMTKPTPTSSGGYWRIMGLNYLDFGGHTEDKLLGCRLSYTITKK